MRLLILGADGMLGHQLALSLAPRHAIVGTVRGPRADYAGCAAMLPAQLHDRIDAADFASVLGVLDSVRPDAVVNAIGIVKQRSESKHAIPSIEINALLPHRLAIACRERGARLLHLSTDCVFSGRKGHYAEDDPADAEDLYGRSKLLGEVGDPGSLTLRTSIIGLELARRKSLIEWFLAQRGTIRGYRQAIYTGFTTLEMARIVEHALLAQPERSGVYQASSEPIDKYTLLVKLRDRLGRDLAIEPDDEFRCDRSLTSDRFRRDFDYSPPTWDEMIDELAVQIQERYA